MSDKQLETEFIIHYVKWVDATFRGGWLNHDALLDALRDGCLVTESVGYLVYQCDAFVAIAQSVTSHTGDGLLMIPRGMILEMYKQSELPSEDKS